METRLVLIDDDGIPERKCSLDREISREQCNKPAGRESVR